MSWASGTLVAAAVIGVPCVGGGSSRARGRNGGRPTGGTQTKQNAALGLTHDGRHRRRAIGALAGRARKTYPEHTRAAATPLPRHCRIAELPGNRTALQPDVVRLTHSRM